MIENEIRTDTEQPRTRRDVVRLGAALFATGLGLASLTGAAAREREAGDAGVAGRTASRDRRSYGLEKQEAGRSRPPASSHCGQRVPGGTAGGTFMIWLVDPVD